MHNAEELRELETVLEGDERARRFFAAYCRMHAGLLFASRAECAVRLAQEGSASPRPVAAPVFGPLTDAWQGTGSYFSQIGPLSYLLAVAITGAMLLGAWVYEITHYQHIARAPSVPSDVRPEMVFVGRITGMVDVKWSDDPRYLPPPGYAHVPLGRKYKLDSGLLQITYDSGAKVILQGPCTYEVESTAGGYLS
ncbi:MAG: hypothetical protein K8R46_14025, partial [Pirellulales bacterium]|nr:hypothetical protein [Pirellulales bacterium]